MPRSLVKFETYNAPHAPREQPEDVVFIAPDHVVAVEQDTVLSYADEKSDDPKKRLRDVARLVMVEGTAYVVDCSAEDAANQLDEAFLPPSDE